MSKCDFYTQENTHSKDLKLHLIQFWLKRITKATWIVIMQTSNKQCHAFRAVVFNLFESLFGQPNPKCHSPISKTSQLKNCLPNYMRPLKVVQTTEGCLEVQA